MSKKEDSEEVSRRLNQQVREAQHGMNYYFSLFLLLFAIPLYVFSQFSFMDASGWQPYDIFFLLALVVFAGYGLYTEFLPSNKLIVWLTTLGLISGIVFAVLF